MADRGLSTSLGVVGCVSRDGRSVVPSGTRCAVADALCCRARLAHQVRWWHAKTLRPQTLGLGLGFSRPVGLGSEHTSRQVTIEYWHAPKLVQSVRTHGNKYRPVGQIGYPLDPRRRRSRSALRLTGKLPLRARESQPVPHTRICRQWIRFGRIWLQS